MQDGGPWLTQTEIGRRIGRGESTIRLWRGRFRDVVPVRLGPDGHLLYPLWVFQEIAAMKADKRSDHEITEHLHEIVGGQATPTGDWQAEARHLAERLEAKLDAIHALVEELLRRSGP